MIVILGGPKIPLAKFWVGTKLLSLLQLRNVGWVRAQSAHPITTSVSKIRNFPYHYALSLITCLFSAKNQYIEPNEIYICAI